MKEFIQLKFPVRFGDGQFFAKKPTPEPEEPEDDDEPEETPTKREEGTPKWAQKIIDLLEPKAEASNSKQQVPVPEAPPVEEDPEEEEQPQPEAPQKKSLLKWLW